MSLAAWLDSRRPRFEAFLADRYLDAWPASFAQPLRYPLETGGKRIRPLLTLAAYEALASDPGGLAPALPAAAAVELVHTYSLVHDDLPCMDDDDLRRGRPTVHKAFDEGTAVLVGDALLTDAFALLAEAPLPAEARVQLVARLAAAAGYRGMVGGQAADVAAGPGLGEADLTRLHRLKTGALLQAAVVMGGLCAAASAEQIRQLEAYGAAVGLAFQLADDVLDADQDAGAEGPPSFVKLLGLEETRRRALAEGEAAVAALAGWPRAEVLVAIARWAADRPV